MAYGTVNADVIGTSVSGSNLGPGNATNFKNRFINGDFRIDQRNAGASLTPTTINTQYSLDRWSMRLTQASKYSVQQSTTVPAGFLNSMVMTSLSSYSLLSTDFFGFGQRIEGFNVVDLGWGTANAKTITLSFWVRSSLTGTFGGSIFGYSLGYPCFPFSYTISAANTWQQISITVPGPTSGTFYTAGIDGYLVVDWSLGAGSATLSSSPNAWDYTTLYRGVTGQQNVVSTNGATLYVTGAQFEVGSNATGFDFRDYGRELIMCQRYFWKTYDQNTVPGTATASNTLVTISGGTAVGSTICGILYPTPMRTAATVTYYSPSGASGKWKDQGLGGDLNVGPYLITNSSYTAEAAALQNMSAGGQAFFGHVTVSAEL